MNDFNLGRHEALISALVEDYGRLAADVHEIRRILSERTGERRVFAWAAGVVGGAVGALLATGLKLIDLVR